MWSLGSGEARLLLYTRILASEELLGLLLALSEVGQVPVRHPGRQGGVHPLLVFPCKFIFSSEHFNVERKLGVWREIEGKWVRMW